MASVQHDFEHLVRQHARVMAAAIRRVCGRRYRALVPDVEQETYLNLWKRLQGGKEIRHPTSYLYKMALTTALAMVRKLGPEEPTEGEQLAQSPPLPSRQEGVADLRPAERTRLLEQVLAQLGREEQRALRAYLAGFNHEEVGELYGWSVSVARHRIYRSIDLLKKMMREGKGR